MLNYFWYLRTINIRYFKNFTRVVFYWLTFYFYQSYLVDKIDICTFTQEWYSGTPTTTDKHTHAVFLYHIAIYCPQLACMAVVLTPSVTCVVGPRPYQRIQTSTALSSGPGLQKPQAQARMMTFPNPDVSGNSLVYLIISWYIMLYKCFFWWQTAFNIAENSSLIFKNTAQIIKQLFRKNGLTRFESWCCFLCLQWAATCWWNPAWP